MIDEYGETVTRLADLPTGVRGFCYHDDDGRCYVILNARLSSEQNARSYQHELEHISRDDLSATGYREYIQGAQQ